MHSSCKEGSFFMVIFAGTNTSNGACFAGIKRWEGSGVPFVLFVLVTCFLICGMKHGSFVCALGTLLVISFRLRIRFEIWMEKGPTLSKILRRQFLSFSCSIHSSFPGTPSIRNILFLLFVVSEFFAFSRRSRTINKVNYKLPGFFYLRCCGFILMWLRGETAVNWR